MFPIEATIGRPRFQHPANGHPPEVRGKEGYEPQMTPLIVVLAPGQPDSSEAIVHGLEGGLPQLGSSRSLASLRRASA